MPRRSKRSSDLATWLGTAATPIFVLDPQRRIRVFNAGCQALTGWTAADVVGEVCHYASIADLAGGAALAASLCPPPEVFTGTQVTAPGQIVVCDGSVSPRTLHFFPLIDAQGQPTGVLGLISDPRPVSALEPVPPAHRLHAELAALRGALRSRFDRQSLVAASLPMKRVLAQLELATRSNTFALLVGEPGTGREHLSRVIHFAGPARTQWYVPLDCRRMAQDELERVIDRLLEVHREQPRGDSPAPQPGTLYLADVESLPRDLQQRLSQQFPGDAHRPPLRLRLLASTTQPWSELLKSGSLRADFAALISPLVIELPPLRERLQDLPLLAQHFVEELNRQGEKQVAGLSEATAALLTSHDWPRNLDELWDLLREAHALASEPLIQPGDLPPRFRPAAVTALPSPVPQPALNLDRLLLEAETRVIRLALRRCKNNRSKAAEMLGIHRTRLIRRIEQLGLADGSPPTKEDPANNPAQPGESSDPAED